MTGDWRQDVGTDVKGHRIRCTFTRLDVFDKLSHNCQQNIFQGGGWKIMKLWDHPDVKGFTVHDQLREFILREDSVNQHAIASSDRAEFLWQLFENAVLGGHFNQFEDDAAAYRNVVKLMYKSLIRCGNQPNACRKCLL